MCSVFANSHRDNCLEFVACWRAELIHAASAARVCIAMDAVHAAAAAAAAEVAVAAVATFMMAMARRVLRANRRTDWLTDAMSSRLSARVDVHNSA